jgi:3-deoxy-D-manno-octulosonic-acid transferase
MRSLSLDLLYLLAMALASPWLVYRLTVTRAWPLAMRRFGVGLEPQSRECVWLHGSSVGEVSLLRPLIAILEREAELDLVISSYTPTGVAAARAAYPRHRVVVFPLDLSFVVRRFLQRLKPRLVIIVESELWPNFLLVTRRHGIPVAVVNGKMSEKSFAIHLRTRMVARALRGVNLLAVQTEEHARRFRALGVPEQAVRVTGNMKYDLATPRLQTDVRAELRAGLGYAHDEIVVIGGSLHSGEDVTLLEAATALAREGLRSTLILVPRYPADAEEVARHVRAAGNEPVLKSAIDRGTASLGRGNVLIVDTVGELTRLYSAADIAFVGGSLFYRGANKGGHNLMEPAIRGVPVLFGPYNFSFKETVEALLEARGGVLVRDVSELRAALTALIANADARTRMGRAAKEVVLRGQGATARNHALITALLEGREARLQAQATDPTMPQPSENQRP